MTIKALITAATLAAVAATPSLAFAAKAKRHVHPAPAAMMAYPADIYADSRSVYIGNQYVGTDPDPTVRLDLRREAGAFDGGAGGD